MSQNNIPHDDEALYREAARRYAIKRGLQVHALVFALVNSGLIALNLLTTPKQIWFIYPLLGWGIGLLAHAATCWNVLAGGRERGIEAEFRRLKARNDKS